SKHLASCILTGIAWSGPFTPTPKPRSGDLPSQPFWSELARRSPPQGVSMSNRLPLGPINAGLRSLYYRLPLATRRRLRRIRRQHLKPLRETLPLSVPETIHLDPTNLCNFKCTFCPTGDRALLKSVGRPI